MTRRPAASRYALLDAAEIVSTASQLERRVGARFPNSGLRKVGGRLVEIAAQAGVRSETIARPLYGLRAGATAVALLIVATCVATFVELHPAVGRIDLPDLIQALESAISGIVFLGAAILFLVTFEGRVRRQRALAAIHDLRVLAHIIDMHQLTKDPEQVVFGRHLTPASPRHGLTPFELSRYLDYCSEMLALLGKLAALYVQEFQDTDSVAAVNDVEQLTSDLARKIWQKIMILHAVCGADLSSDVPAGRSPDADAPAVTAASPPP